MKKQSAKKPNAGKASMAKGPIDLFDEALGHQQAGRPDEAEACCRTLLARDGSDGDAHHLLGVLLLNKGEAEAAEIELNKALEHIPQSPEAWCNLGLVERALGKLEAACEHFKKALVLLPGFAGAENNLGLTLSDLGAYDDAIAVFQKAIEEGRASSNLRSNLGIAYFGRGDFFCGLEAYKAALSEDPQSPLALYNMGTGLREVGQSAEATDYYRKALGLAADNIDILNNLAVALLDQSDASGALSYINQALAIDAGSTQALYNGHAALLSLGHEAEALDFLRRAVEADLGSGDYLVHLGILCDWLGHHDHAEVFFSELDPGDALAQANLDSWRYLKDHIRPDAKLTGTVMDGFRLAMDAARPEGLVAEFGVRFGETIRQIASLTDGPVHGFDSFEGLPVAWGDEAAGSYTTQGQLPTVPDQVSLHQGWFDQTLAPFVAAHKQPVRFLHIDCDLYVSTKTVLDLLGPMVGPGSVIVFDELIGHSRWRDDEFKAFQEAVEKFNWSYEYLSFSFFTRQVAVVIK